jgi:hypothetical protein
MIELAEYDLGKKCQEFLNTDVGRYLHGVAAQEVQTCASYLLDCDPDDAKAIRAIQSRAKGAHNFIVWLNEAIENGEQAGLLILEEGRMT